MLKTVHFIENIESRYQALQHFQKKLQEALHRQGIGSKTFNLVHDTEDVIMAAFEKDTPDCTIGFNILIAGYEFLKKHHMCHVALLVDPICFFPEILDCPSIIPAFVEKDSCTFLQHIGDSRGFFLPHAVEKEMVDEKEDSAIINSKRIYDVVLPASFLDPKKEIEDWKKVYSAKSVTVLLDIANMVLSSSTVNQYDAFMKATQENHAFAQEIQEKRIPFLRLITSLTQYIRAVDRIKLVQAVKEFEIHIFCTACDIPKWQSILAPSQKVSFHKDIPFHTLSTILDQSKVVLNSVPSHRRGFHERLFFALARGASVLSVGNDLYGDMFGHNRANICLSPDYYSQASYMIHHALSNEEARKNDIAEARKIIREQHTWDIRAAFLNKIVPEKMKLCRK